ncbi:MAG: M28 family peptidase [Candidatus Heimdallarchaeota archaeon]|nr:M28 family peptidase [Candidatus Heimdallarchaeota archaeon]
MDDQKIIAHLKGFIEQIAVDRNPYTAPKMHKRIPKMIHHRWQVWGQHAELHQLDHFGHKGHNIWIPPKDLNKPCILLLAHHDSVPNCPCVDDNGSGMAILDFLAYYYSNTIPALNIAFAMVDWEESDPRVWKPFDDWSTVSEYKWHDMHIIPREEHYKFRNYLHKHVQDVTSFTGSRKLLEFLKITEIKIDVVLNFETVGFTADKQDMPRGVPIQPEKGDFVALVGNMLSEFWTAELIKNAAEGFFLPLLVPMNGKSMPDTRRGDHAVFWDNNTAAIMITDTANYRNPHYHKSTDTEVDYQFMTQIIKAMISFIQAKLE